MSTAARTADLTSRLTLALGEDRVHRPGEARYVEATSVWNGAVTTRPAVVVRPGDTAGVAAAVVAARACGVAMSVRGGGHDWAGRSLCADGLVIDLDGLREVEVTGDVAVVGGGSRTADVVAAATPLGMNVASGTAGVVGLAGLSLGGGYGPLLGTAGLAADNILAAEVVLADGRVVSTDDDPELLWALRGGGGNFGIVTSLRIALHPDRGLVGGMVLFEWDQARTVLKRYAEMLATPDDGLTSLVELTVVPDVGPCVLVVPVWSGSSPGADAAMQRVLDLGTPLSSSFAATTQKDLLAQFDSSVPVGMHWDIRTRSLLALTPDILDLLVRHAQDRPGPGAGIGLRRFHGAAARVGAGDTAFGLRTEHVVVEISAGRGPDDDATSYRAWADGLSSALVPYALPGGYPNFLGAEHWEQAEHAYGTNASRLLEVKRAYDPDGVFTATPLPRG